MRGRALGLAVVVALAPEIASACASCAWSGFGDRSYNWAFVGLLALPFAIVGVVGGLIMAQVRRASAADLEPGEARSRVSRVDASERRWSSATIEERT